MTEYLLAEFFFPDFFFQNFFSPIFFSRIFFPRFFFFFFFFFCLQNRGAPYTQVRLIHRDLRYMKKWRPIECLLVSSPLFIVHINVNDVGLRKVKACECNTSHSVYMYESPKTWHETDSPTKQSIQYSTLLFVFHTKVNTWVLTNTLGIGHPRCTLWPAASSHVTPTHSTV